MNFEKLNFEEKVLVALKRKDMSQTKLAEELGISVQYLRDIIKGNRISDSYKEEICKKLEINN